MQHRPGRTCSGPAINKASEFQLSPFLGRAIITRKIGERRQEGAKHGLQTHAIKIDPSHFPTSASMMIKAGRPCLFAPCPLPPLARARAAHEGKIQFFSPTPSASLLSAGAPSKTKKRDFDYKEYKQGARPERPLVAQRQTNRVSRLFWAIS